MAIEIIIEPFEYLDTLVEKVKLLVHEIGEKNKALASTQTSLSRMEVVIDEKKWYLDPYKKRI